jgi:hypothetical protein
MTASADDRQTRTPCSAPQMEKPDEVREKTDERKRQHRQTTNKNSLVCNADVKTRRNAEGDFVFFFSLEKTKEERMENQRVEKGSLPQA